MARKNSKTFMPFAYEMGFDDLIKNSGDQSDKFANRRTRFLFDSYIAGRDAGKRVLEAAGGRQGLSDLFARSVHLHIRSNKIHNRLPDKVRREIKRPPCDDLCRFVGFCEKTAMVCEKFKYYANDKRSKDVKLMIPDMSWDEAFPDKEDNDNDN